MKSDILRRVEEMASSEQETRIAEEPLLAGDTGKGRTVSVAYLDDSDIESAVGLRGDGEDSDAGEDEDDHDEAPGPPADPERILVLAYTRDPKLFDRDAHTRRNKARADLKAATGMVFSSSHLHLILSASNCLHAWQAGEMNRSRAGESCWTETRVSICSCSNPSLTQVSRTPVQEGRDPPQIRVCWKQASAESRRPARDKPH
jgi:hypothetical protein